MDVLDLSDDTIEGLPERLFARLVVEAADEDGAILVSAHGIFVEVRSP